MSDSEETSSSEFLIESGDSDISSSDENLNTGLYNNEPEYSKEECKKRKLDSSSETDDSDDNLDSSRLENLHWCTCKICVIGIEMTLDECKCCRECNILGEKLEGIQCITENDDFKILCLNKIVLETACIRHRRYNNNFKDLRIFMNK